MNNFITELLDKMPGLTSDELILQANAEPLYLRKGMVLKGTRNPRVDRDELLEDLAALGIVGRPVDKDFIYKPDLGKFESMVFEIVNEPIFAYLSFHFKLIELEERSNDCSHIGCSL